MPSAAYDDQIAAFFLGHTHNFFRRITALLTDMVRYIRFIQDAACVRKGRIFSLRDVLFIKASIECPAVGSGSVAGLKNIDKSQPCLKLVRKARSNSGGLERTF